jgi:small-conductance mechanosensitive channel
MSKVAQKVEREAGTGTDLWRVILSPIIWAVHFLFCYIGTAIWCAKAGRDASTDPARWIVGIATALALLGIGSIALSFWRTRARSLTDDDFEFEYNSPEERHRFLSHIALMLCLLSAVAVTYVALPAALVSTCL